MDRAPIWGGGGWCCRITWCRIIGWRRRIGSVGLAGVVDTEDYYCFWGGERTCISGVDGEINPIAGRLPEAPSPGLCLVGHLIFNCSVVGVGGHHSNNYSTIISNVN